MRDWRMAKAKLTHQQFAKLMRQWRRRRDFSQRDGADYLGISKRTLENWEQERAMPQGLGLNAVLRTIGARK